MAEQTAETAEETKAREQRRATEDADRKAASPSPGSEQPEPLPSELEPARRAAMGGAPLTDGEEVTALTYLLGASVALEFDVKAELETVDGLKPLTFHIRQLDPAVIERIDADHRKGDGPFAKLDVPAYNAALAAEATVYFTDESGEKIDPKGDVFRGGAPGGPGEAMALRFKYQPGILESVAEQVKLIGGYSADRVGTAQRSVTRAGKP